VRSASHMAQDFSTRLPRLKWENLVEDKRNLICFVFLITTSASCRLSELWL
jgi:hypothetical protein